MFEISNSYMFWAVILLDILLIILLGIIVWGMIERRNSDKFCTERLHQLRFEILKEELIIISSELKFIKSKLSSDESEDEKLA